MSFLTLVIINLVLKSNILLICVFFASKTVIKYIFKSPVYSCFVDASKASDKINHWTLYKKLIKISIPPAIIRMLLFWYETQSVCIK